MKHLQLSGRQKPYVMAHRGNQTLFPENTRSAFMQAAADGADIVETDLQVTADGRFLCLHDDTVDRTTDGTGNVGQMTFDSARTLNAAASRSDLPFEPIPTLGELAQAVPSPLMTALELKSDAFLDPTVCQQLIRELQGEGLLERCFFLSFSSRRLQTLRSVDRSLPIGWITVSQPWPRSGVEMFGPYWPLLLFNPLLTLWARLMGQLVCPLDPAPERRIGLYRLLGCDALLSDDPAKTLRALGRSYA